MDLPRDHSIGLLLGAVEDWAQAFEAVLRRVGPISTPCAGSNGSGGTHTFTSERVAIGAFGLADPVRSGLVIDRVGQVSDHAREWLKKAALVNGSYLLNNPFTYQSMDRLSAQSVMQRLRLRVPPTVVIPGIGAGDGAREPAVDLAAIGSRLGYPLYVKPVDSVSRNGVRRFQSGAELLRAQDELEGPAIELQAAVSHDRYARVLSIGPETMVMDYRPERPDHSRYAVSHDFLSPSAGAQAVAISRLIGAVFGWEFNSVELLVRGDDVIAIDYVDACPDIAVTSLHYYFPWAIRALVRWSIYCLATGRSASVDGHMQRYFAIADDPSLDAEARLAAYLAVADEHFDTERYWQWCAEHLPHLDDQVLDWVTSPEFDRLLKEMVRARFPLTEQHAFLDHFHGLVDLWVIDEGARRRQ